jgi:hypothetical protein
MQRNGGSESWTDAIFPLNTYVGTVPATSVVTMDWGILEGLRLLSRGSLPLQPADDRISTADTKAEDREVVSQIVSDSGNLYVAHTRDAQLFPTNEKFITLAAGLGYRRDSVAVIADSFGRPTFETYRLVRASE